MITSFFLIFWNCNCYFHMFRCRNNWSGRHAICKLLALNFNIIEIIQFQISVPTPTVLWTIPGRTRHDFSPSQSNSESNNGLCTPDGLMAISSVPVILVFITWKYIRGQSNLSHLLFPSVSRTNRRSLQRVHIFYSYSVSWQNIAIQIGTHQNSCFVVNRIWRVSISFRDVIKKCVSFSSYLTFYR